MSFRRKYIALVASVMLLSTAMAQSVQQEYNIDDYNRLSTLSITELMARGQYFLQEKMMVDSALVCYSIVSNREHDKKLNREELHLIARAKNNLGYIYGAHYYDYPKSYENLNRAIQLSEEYGFDDISSYAYMNLASTMKGRNDLFGDDSFSTEVFENTKMAFNKAVQAKEWNVAVTCLFNALAMMNENDDIHSIKSELDRFERLQSIDSIEMWQCTRMFCEGVQAYYAGQYQQALDYYVKMEHEAHRLLTNRQQCILMAMNQQSVVFAAMHRYQDAIAIQLHFVSGSEKRFWSKLGKKRVVGNGVHSAITLAKAARDIFAPGTSVFEIEEPWLDLASCIFIFDDVDHSCCE